jgi:hypothetical protein
MNILEEQTRQFCLTAPRWMQLQFQAFWYGLLSTAITYVEEKRTVTEIITKPHELCVFVDPEFEGWPCSWLEQFLTDFLALSHTEETLHHFLERLDDLFRDCVPVDLHIFSILTSGSIIDQEQWGHLHDALAFTLPIDQKQFKNKQKQRTRCTHGRRAVTPMRSRKALTRKSRPNHNPVVVFKLNK